MTRPLNSDDVRLFQSLREPLSGWLRVTHGYAGRRVGLQGLCSAAVALVGMHAFGISPLLALLHALIPLAADGIGALFCIGRMRARPAAGDLPFLTPAHALAFARAVTDVYRGSGVAGSAGLLPGEVLPGAKTLAMLFPRSGITQTGPEARWVFFVRWLFVVPVMVVAGIFFATFAVLMFWPLAQASVSLFDRYDWLGLVAFLCINVVQLVSTRNAYRQVDHGAPWAIAWLVEPPRLGDLMFWRLYKPFPLVLALVTGFLMVLPPTLVVKYYKDPVTLAQAVDAQLLGVATMLFGLLTLLNTLLLAAPAHARRLISELHSVDIPQAAPTSGSPPPSR